MDGLMVLSPGSLTTVQDGGRTGWSDSGVPPSGAADPRSMALANLLLSNDPGEACLECTLSGPTLEFTGPAAFALAGADMEPTLNGRPVPAWRALYAEQGDILSLGTAVRGLRTCVALAGGLDLEPVLGSRSTCLLAGFGGLEGRALRPGDRLDLRLQRPPAGLDGREIPPGDRLEPGAPIEPRAIRSHEEGLFRAGSAGTFFSASWRVSPASDRMGLRLQGPALSHVRGAGILSGGVRTGTVQVPGDGQPLVLMPDRQATGGYARIAHVATADLHLLGQARPGDLLRFREIGLAEARGLLLDAREELGRIARELELARSFRVSLCGLDYLVRVLPAD